MQWPAAADYFRGTRAARSGRATRLCAGNETSRLAHRLCGGSRIAHPLDTRATASRPRRTSPDLNVALSHSEHDLYPTILTCAVVVCWSALDEDRRARVC